LWCRCITSGLSWQSWSIGCSYSELDLMRVDMPPNSPVNTDACGRAAMHLVRRARAGYRER